MLSNVQNFKLLRAKAHHVVKQQKRNSWRHFCNKLNSKTQTQKVWKAIRKIKGKGGCNSINHLKVYGNLITDKKEMERMINARLMWSLESQGFLSEKQCGFRKNHSTLDHLVRFETCIRNAFVKKEHVLTIFFALKKLTTQHGSTAFWWTSGISVSGATPPGLFRASCWNALSGLEWVLLFLSGMSRRWGSRKVASCLRPISALKLTTLLKLS